MLFIISVVKRCPYAVCQLKIGKQSEYSFFNVPHPLTSDLQHLPILSAAVRLLLWPIKNDCVGKGRLFNT